MAGNQGKSAELDGVTSYRDLRRGIGGLGIALPIVLVVGYLGFRNSISAYYYTDMRSWLVGSLWAIGFFLVFYRYVERKPDNKPGKADKPDKPKKPDKRDNILSSIAGILAILVSLFPTAPDIPNPSRRARLIGDFHLAFAACFLLLLAHFCLCLFTLSHAKPEWQGKKKRQRNAIYRICGVVILVAVGGAGLFLKLSSGAFCNTYHPVFWCESAAVLAFGIAWFIKGDTLLKDRPETAS